MRSASGWQVLTGTALTGLPGSTNFGYDAERVYLPEVLARLLQLKRKYDPNGVIRCNRPVLTEPAL